MIEIWNLLSSPPFIVGSLICGLLINLLSNYAQRRLDRASDRLGAWRRGRTEARRAAFDAQLRELVNHADLVELYVAREARLWGACVAFMLLGVTLGGLFLATASASIYLAVPRLIIAAGSVFLIVGSMVLLDTAMSAGDVLRALYKHRLERGLKAE